jgi:hypothetical protein
VYRVVDREQRGDVALELVGRGEDQGEPGEAGDRGALALLVSEDGLHSSLKRCPLSGWM